MNKFKVFENLITLEKLIRQRCTGTPDELARRLSISRSALYEIIDELKARGVEIKYCRTRCSFYYNNGMILDIRFDIKGLTHIDNPDELKDISGGCKLFSSVHYIGRRCCNFADGNILQCAM